MSPERPGMERRPVETLDQDPALIRAHAAAAIDRGWSVFPVQGKKPLAGTRGFHDATRNYDLVDTLWPHASGRGIGVATGGASRVFVLDLDGAEGIRGFLRLQKEHGELPPTVTAQTPRGFHLYLRMPEGGDVRSSAKEVAPGIDVRGTGGYVVMPPSPHPDGGLYRWLEGHSPEEVLPINPPAWVLEAVRPRRKTPRPLPAPKPRRGSGRGLSWIVDEECRLVAYAPEGTRNDQLNRSAFALARFVSGGELDPADVAGRLAHAAGRAGLSSGEIEKTILSAFKGREVAV